VTYALHPEFFAVERGPVRVVPDGIARGQTILKPEGETYPVADWDNRPSQAVAVGVQSGRVLALYRSIFG
jgi:purine nucleosidase